MKLIDKDALVAEIERRIADNKKEIERASHKNLEDYFDGYEDGLALLKQQFLDTLKVKEVDLQKEIDSYIETSLTGTNSIYTKGAVSCIIEKTAKHFFELGLKAQKGE